ncbi:MAG: hypothetical protein LBK83_16645 [Treponema sp.]|nr:hypothetical protein [Treponema sp.]
MTTPKEHFMNYYTGKPMERFPNVMTDTNVLCSPSLSITALNERGPNDMGGKDWYGSWWVYDAINDAPVPDTSKPPVLTDITEWRGQLTFPDVDAIDWEANAKKDGVGEFDPDKANFYMLCEGPFERLHTLMGFEEALCAMATEPESVAELFNAIMDVKLRCIDAVVKYYKADVINFHDDWGTQINLFFSPEMWRELLKPQIKKAVDRCHLYKVPFELHCCGKIEKIIPELVDIGVDSIQCQGINNIAAMKKITGDKIGYTVSPRYQEWVVLDELGQLTEEKARKMLRDEIETEAVGGRYYSFFWPLKAWWLDAVNDEIEKAGKDIYGYRD